MSTMKVLSLLFLISSLFPLSQSQPPNGILINCGATTNSIIEDREWVSDNEYISSGTPMNLTTPDVIPYLSTVRSFPLHVGKKYCYVYKVYRPSKYLIRTTYFYGGVNGREMPPVFDQIVDGTLWSIVNTTEDYLRGDSSYYEGIFAPGGNTMSVCVAANTYTDSDPFISALEFIHLADSLYNSTDFGRFGLRLVARHSFGYSGSIIRYPDDQFDRIWQPFGSHNPTMERVTNVSTSGFWNLPPSKLFQTHLTTAVPEPLELPWPLMALPSSIYYISLYFADDRSSSSGSPRAFRISLNGVTYLQELNVGPAGVAVFANRWPLEGPVKITLSPAPGSNIGPVINAGEIFDVLTLGGRTHTRDVIAIESMRNSFQNVPVGWNGDPCLPRQYTWTGIRCSDGPRIRVVALNLTSMGLSGSLSPNIANLTALTDIWLGNNSLSGSLPDLSPLRRLETIHLEDNQFSGEIPSSLGNLDSLRELFLQGNNFTGQVPNSLIGKSGLNIRTTPGNPFLSPRA